MKRLIFCIIILLLMAGQSVGSLCLLHRQNAEFSTVLDRAVVLAHDNQKEQALEAIDDVECAWDEYYITASYLVPAGRIEPICFSVAKLKSLLIADNPEFFSECETISRALEFLYEKEFPHLHSII